MSGWRNFSAQTQVDLRDARNQHLVLMRTVRLRSQILIPGMAAVLALPYTAPTVCGMLGRMGNEVEMTVDAGTDTAQALDSDGMCCTLNECGIAQVAPPAYVLNILDQTRTILVELPAPPSADPTGAYLPLTPPPQA